MAARASASHARIQKSMPKDAPAPLWLMLLHSVQQRQRGHFGPDQRSVGLHTDVMDNFFGKEAKSTGEVGSDAA